MAGWLLEPGPVDYRFAARVFLAGNLGELEKSRGPSAANTVEHFGGDQGRRLFNSRPPRRQW
jgi:hypothetical protein